MNYVQKIKKTLKGKIDVEDELLNLYALLVLVKGEGTTWEDVHDAWSAWMDDIKPKHKSLVPFKELSKQVQEYDKEYAKAIIETAKELRTNQ